MPISSPSKPLLILLLAGFLAALLSVSIGSTSIGFGDTLRVITGSGTELQQTLILELRLPRTLSAFATGGLLAVAGALMQVLLRNPLADPYVLGLSGGAAVGALLAMLAGAAGFLISGSAFAGAMLATLLVFGLAHGCRRHSVAQTECLSDRTARADTKIELHL